MGKQEKKVHFGLPYSKRNPVKIPICMLHAEGVRARCGIVPGADWETVGIAGLEQITCKKCRAELNRRLREGGWR